MLVNYLLIRFPQRYIFIWSWSPVLRCSCTIHRILWSQIQRTRIPVPLCWGAVAAMQLILLNSLANLRETERKWFQTDPKFKSHLFVSPAECFPSQCYFQLTKTFYMNQNFQKKLNVQVKNYWTYIFSNLLSKSEKGCSFFGFLSFFSWPGALMEFYMNLQVNLLALKLHFLSITYC